MERERGLDDKDICAQAMVAFIFFPPFLPLRQGTKTFPSEGVFWNCFMQMGGLQRCFLIRGYHGLARVHERKKTVPEPKVAMMLSLGLIRLRHTWQGGI